ncbi:unnamed protein product, partial [Ixodes pacificus]
YFPSRPRDFTYWWPSLVESRRKADDQDQERDLYRHQPQAAARRHRRAVKAAVVTWQLELLSRERKTNKKKIIQATLAKHIPTVPAYGKSTKCGRGLEQFCATGFSCIP